ncbi:MAG: hypothetical protein M3Y51_00575 [Actinomycetota bacterium]|nr:hypothetical protein [Actinomycetota bacterium]
MVDTSGRDTGARASGAGVATARGDARLPPQEPHSAADALADGSSPVADLHPVGPAAVLDGGFDLFRFRFRRLVGFAACLFVPLTVVDLVLMAAVGTETPERVAIGPSMFLLGSGDSWSWAILVGQTVALSLLGLCVGHLAASAARGVDVSFREMGRLALRRWWVALLIVVLTALPRALLSCVVFPVGWLLADGLFFIASSVAGAEGVGPWRAVTRSVSLTRARFGNALVICLGSLVISQVLRISLTAGPALLLSSFALPESVVGVVARLGTVVLLLAEPITACIAARAYLDLRARHEGLDLQLRAERVLGDAHRTSVALQPATGRR